MEHSGIYAEIVGVSALRQWQINEGFTTVKSVASNTAHGTNRHRGIYDWTGQYSAYGGLPAYMPGEYFDIDAYKAPDASDNLANGQRFQGNVLVLSTAITINFQSNEMISHVTQFGGNGDLTIDDAAAHVPDVSAVAEKTPCAGKIVVYDGMDEAIIPHVTTAVLTFTREAKTSVNSGTTTGTGKCTTKRRLGPAIDWTLAITTEDGQELAIVQSGTVQNIRAYIDAATFWDLKWGLFGPRSGLTVNRETGDIISQTHNAEMKGYKSGVGVGFIKKPGGATFWPFA